MTDRIAKAEAAVPKAKERLTLADARAATAVIRMREAEEAVWRAENRLRTLRGDALRCTAPGGGLAP